MSRNGVGSWDIFFLFCFSSPLISSFLSTATLCQYREGLVQREKEKAFDTDKDSLCVAESRQLINSEIM